MKFDAFTAGITPGGLRTRNDIKVLICYILANIKQNLTQADIVAILQENSLANYFEVNDAFSDLLENSNIEPTINNKNAFVLTDSGKLIANQLEASLPLSIREHAITATLSLMSKQKLYSENRVTIKKETQGCTVTCSIPDGNITLMSFSIHVPDMLQAELVKKNFYDNPTRIYKLMIATVTKNKDLIKELLSKDLE